MPVIEEFELELTRLAQWHWEMRGSPEGSPDEDWFWAEEELRRQRLTTACEAGKEPADA